MDGHDTSCRNKLGSGVMVCLKHSLGKQKLQVTLGIYTH